MNALEIRDLSVCYENQFVFSVNALFCMEKRKRIGEKKRWGSCIKRKKSTY